VSELLFKPATELADLVRRGELSATELVEASLARIEEVDEVINAWVLVDAEGALATAGEIDGAAEGDARPFAGVPIAIKDLYAPVAGLPLSQGSDLFGDYTPTHDYAVVRRLREAGFVIVGKVNTPEFGIPPVTEPRRHGPTRNPWDTERTPGGSSGGSSAAVASGTVPVAHGSDGGGSIRIPAACTGLVGLKPARGRISRAPDLGDHFLGTDGALTRTVEDAAALLDVMAGYEPGDATWAPPPPEPFVEATRREPGRLRIGLTVDMPIESELDPLCERAARDAAELLESLGHQVDEFEAPWKEGNLLPVFSVLWAANVAASVRHAEIVTGTKAGPESVEPLTWHLHQQALGYTSADYVVAEATLQGVARHVITELWSRHDVVLTPALAKRPVRIGEIDTQGENPAYEFKKSGQFTPYTALWNITGQPAMSVPLFHGDDGLPLAVQLVGPPAREDVLLSLAAQLEAARPWAERRPELAASP
jgi:amidase